MIAGFGAGDELPHLDLVQDWCGWRLRRGGSCGSEHRPPASASVYQKSGLDSIQSAA